MRIDAGGAYRQTGSDVAAARDIDISAQSVDIRTADNHGRSRRSERDLKIGTFAKISSPLIDLVNAAEGAAKSKADDRTLALQGLAAGAQAYQEARSWGIGGSKSRALSAAETLITGALGGQGDLQLAANTLAPYAAAAIGKRFGHGENKNEAAQAIGHFMLGAALAYANGADPLADGSAAVAAERAAEYLAKQYDDGKTAIDPITGKFNPNLLPEHIKEEIKAQTGAIASVVGAAGGSLKGSGTNNGNGNALFNAQVGGVLGQNAVGNNYLSKEETIEFERRLEQCAIGDKKCLDETFADARMRSAKNRNDLILQCQRGGDQDPACAAKKVEIREGLQYVTSEEYAPLYASRQYPPRRKWAQLEPVTQTDSISHFARYG